MIDRYLLRYFLAVVDRGNFSRAAEACRVSQPTLSVGIARLETLLGRPLFERSNRRVALTTAGLRLVVHARRIEAEFADAEHAVLLDAPVKLIRLGIATTLPTAWLEQAIAATRGVETERLEIVEARSSGLLPLLARGRIDVALTAGIGSSMHEFVFEESFAMAFSAEHPLADLPMIAADQLAGEPMIVRRQCEALAETSRFFTARGVRPFMAAKTVRDDRAVAYVRAGLATTLLPASFAQPGIRLIPLAGFGLTRRVGFIHDAASLSRIEGSRSIAIIADVLRRCHEHLPRD